MLSQAAKTFAQEALTFLSTCYFVFAGVFRSLQSRKKTRPKFKTKTFNLIEERPAAKYFNLFTFFLLGFFLPFHWHFFFSCIFSTPANQLMVFLYRSDKYTAMRTRFCVCAIIYNTYKSNRSYVIAHIMPSVIVRNLVRGRFKPPKQIWPMPCNTKLQ